MAPPFKRGAGAPRGQRTAFAAVAGSRRQQPAAQVRHHHRSLLAFETAPTNNEFIAELSVCFHFTHTGHDRRARLVIFSHPRAQRAIGQLILVTRYIDNCTRRSWDDRFEHTQNNLDAHRGIKPCLSSSPTPPCGNKSRRVSPPKIAELTSHWQSQRLQIRECLPGSLPG